MFIFCGNYDEKVLCIQPISKGKAAIIGIVGKINPAKLLCCGWYLLNKRSTTSGIIFLSK